MTNYDRLPNLDSFEIKTSRSGHKVPVVNNVHLHSAYNPIKEAQTFLKKYEELLSTKKYFLVLGLGFGYHILQSIYKIKQHSKDFKMIVIEPFEEVRNNCIDLNLIDPSECEILSGQSAFELYKNKSLVELLLNSPGVLAHTASFNLSNEYFKDFLTYKATLNSKDIAKDVVDKDVNEYLASFKDGTNFNQLVQSLSANTAATEIDELKLKLLHSVAQSV